MTADTAFEMGCCYACGHDAFGRKLLTIREAAIFCKVSTTTIYHWMDRDLIDWVKTAGGKRRIFQDSLIQRVPPPDPAPQGEEAEAA